MAYRLLDMGTNSKAGLAWHATIYLYFQAPNAMPEPLIVICLHRPPEILLLSHIISHYGENLTHKGKSSTLMKSVGIINTLTALYDGLQNIDVDAENSSLESWKSVKNDIVSRYIFTR